MNDGIDIDNIEALRNKVIDLTYGYFIDDNMINVTKLEKTIELIVQVLVKMQIAEIRINQVATDFVGDDSKEQMIQHIQAYNNKATKIIVNKNAYIYDEIYKNIIVYGVEQEENTLHKESD